MNWIKNSIKPYAHLPASIYAIFFASLINYLGNFVSPFLALFLTNKAGISIEIVGIIITVNSCATMIGTILGGKLIDSIGRKKILLIFRTSSGIGYALCALTHNPILITCLLIISNFLNSFSEPVYSTIITDVTNKEQRNAAFSLSYMAMNIGYSVATLTAGFLYSHFIVLLFLGDAFTTFISVILIGIFVPETLPDKTDINKMQPNNLEKGDEGNAFALLIKKPMLLKFSLILIIYYIVFSQFTFGLPLQVTDVFKSNGSILYGSLITINAIICGTLTVFIGSATQNLKSSASISIGGIMYTIGFGAGPVIAGVCVKNASADNINYLLTLLHC